MTVTAPSRATRGVDLLGWLLFGGYVLGAAYVLGQGLVALVASASPAVHELLHVQAITDGFMARTAERVADASHGVPPGPQVLLDYLGSLVNLALAALVLRLRPHDRTARLLALALVGAAGVFNLTAQGVLETLPLTSVEATVQTAAHVVAGLAYVSALVLFPDGRAVPRWSAAGLGLLYVPIGVAAVLLAVRTSGVHRPLTLLLFFGVAVPLVGVATQLYRMRRAATSTELAQARLLFFSLVPALLLAIGFLVMSGPTPGATAFVGRHLPDLPTALYRVFQLTFGLIPLALFVGLVRYRLWDIERIINRTLIYASVTMLLGGVYAGFVILVQVTVGQVGRSPLIDSKPAVAITTLVLASAIRPLRDRVQAFVERRFHRRRYDALMTVERFGACIRDEVSLEAVAVQLTSIVDEVLQPRDVRLWTPTRTSGEQDRRRLSPTDGHPVPPGVHAAARSQ